MWAVIGVGLVYMLVSRRAEQSTGPFSDAIPVNQPAAAIKR